jgi:hypothetical protein
MLLEVVTERQINYHIRKVRVDLLEKVMKAEDESKFHKLGERLRGHLAFAVVGCTATSGTILVASEQKDASRLSYCGWRVSSLMSLKPTF